VPKPYPAEFRVRAVALVRAGSTISAAASALGTVRLQGPGWLLAWHHGPPPIGRYGCSRMWPSLRWTMADTDLPIGIDRARHQDLTGRNHHVWWRRAALSLVAVVPALALFNVFGQHAEPESLQSSAAALLVNSPVHVRGGLVFTTEIVITPHEQLQDARLYLEQGWFAGMTLNGVSPQPGSQSSQGRWQIWDFGKIRAGSPYTVWIAWQTDATNIGRHSQDVALYNGGRQLMTVHRTLTIFP
jgi:hypothetical protein